MLCLLCAEVVSETETSGPIPDADTCCKSLCTLLELDLNAHGDSLSAAVYCHNCFKYLTATAIIMSEIDPNQKCFQDVLEKPKRHVQNVLIQSWIKLQSEDVYSDNFCPWQSVRLRILLELGSVIEVVPEENNLTLSEHSILEDMENLQDASSLQERNRTATASGFAPWNFENAMERNAGTAPYFMVQENENLDPICIVLHDKSQESPCNSQSTESEPEAITTKGATNDSPISHTDDFPRMNQDEPNVASLCTKNGNNVLSIDQIESCSELVQKINDSIGGSTKDGNHEEERQPDIFVPALSKSVTEKIPLVQIQPEPASDLCNERRNSNQDSRIDIGGMSNNDVIPKGIPTIPVIHTTAVQGTSPNSELVNFSPPVFIRTYSNPRKSKRKPLKPTKGIYSLKPILQLPDSPFSNTLLPVPEPNISLKHPPAVPTSASVHDEIPKESNEEKPSFDNGHCSSLANQSTESITSSTDSVATFIENLEEQYIQSPNDLGDADVELESLPSIVSPSPEIMPEQFHLSLVALDNDTPQTLSQLSCEKTGDEAATDDSTILRELDVAFVGRMTRSKYASSLQSPVKSESDRRGENLETPHSSSSSLSLNNDDTLLSVDRIVTSSMDSPPSSLHNADISSSVCPSSTSPPQVDEKTGSSERPKRRRIVLTDKYASYSSEISKRRTANKAKAEVEESKDVKFNIDVNIKKETKRSECDSSDSDFDSDSDPDPDSDSDSQNSNNSYWLPKSSSRRQTFKERVANHKTDAELAVATSGEVGESSSKTTRGSLGKKVMKFICNFGDCARRFSTKERRDNHIKRTHEGVRNLFSCTQCRKTFPAKNRLLTHLKKHELQGKTFPCNQCDKKFPTEKKLNFHLHQHSQNWGLYCDICGKGFLTGQEARLKNHKKIHDEARPRPYKCGECDRTFSTEQYLKIHQKKHPLQPDEDGLYRCRMDSCMLSFKAVTSFREHLRLHTGELPFECHVCKKKFGYITGYKKHMISHTDEKEYTCHICGKQFKQKGNLNLHIGRHNGVKPYACKHPGCKYSFFDQYKLKNHMDVHTGRRTYKCGECDKSFRTTTALKAHHAAIHTKERKFKCHCGKTFTQKQYLTFHKTSHPELNLKKFQCEICSKKFTEPSSLREHKRRFHTQDTAFSCDKCSYTACFPSRMDKHMLTHSEPQFSCNICGRNFRQGNNLKRHMKTMHK